MNLLSLMGRAVLHSASFYLGHPLGLAPAPIYKYVSVTYFPSQLLTYLSLLYKYYLSIYLSLPPTLRTSLHTVLSTLHALSH